MKKRRPDTSALDHLETANTGHHCPKTGWWSLKWNEEAATFITEGQVMPAVGGVPAVWVLREAANRGRAHGISLLAAS
ncbi:hypothetical protein [Paenarthrobacter nitroguajacolicus]|uniref:hypothetical protein n=1 Tax=Paenarthrobacter nitroguajacolicus TaxID=211146 RepID=UPI0015BF324E|nr:hypothetical protein [Paenarthrobacter nitroguajacolicus]NWL34384.1 hypothetical protein [Paenarthrobacter nitroguajacolicus]